VDSAAGAAAAVAALPASAHLLAYAAGLAANLSAGVAACLILILEVIPQALFLQGVRGGLEVDEAEVPEQQVPASPAICQRPMFCTKA
jgi:hypothetical protein